jgi:hypothetical protein
MLSIQQKYFDRLFLAEEIEEKEEENAKNEENAKIRKEVNKVHPRDFLESLESFNSPSSLG